MKVTILEPSGYCAGVERAMDLAIKTREKETHKPVVVLGMLVHNENSLKTLEKHEIKTIYEKNCSLEQLIDRIEEPSIVILTAHGHAKTVEEKLIKNGHTIVDATCPFVKNSFSEILKAINENRTVFYIGVKNHPEAVAALSLSSNVVFVDVKEPKIPKNITSLPLVISQTTLSKFEVLEVNKQIKETYPNAEFLNGICNASTKRQQTLFEIDDDVDLILVAGGTNSNNSKTLFKLAKNLYPTRKVLLIQNASEINIKDLNGLSHVAISSGASTPKEIINEIKTKLLN